MGTIMTDAIRELFNDYEFHTEAGASLIEKYGGRLPTQILDLWKTYGFGTFYEGYLKMVDPDEYKEQIARMYVNGEKATDGGGIQYITPFSAEELIELGMIKRKFLEMC